ncbi:MAG: efflux RND transporter periplasmic adaptor subunit [Acidobacteriota bacterium]|nr:efflux RND transporter periplasmic adaptor subunit [Acidobacteriota bacterium]
MKKWLLTALALAAAVIGWGILRKTSPPKISFIRAKRITLVSTLPTNGKVEPFEWQAIRASRSGILSRVRVREGQLVARDEEIASIREPSLQTDIEASEARVAEARANLSALEGGGRPAELAEIDSSLKQAELQYQQEQKDYGALQRLAKEQAATAVEVEAAHQKVEQSLTAIQGLERRRESLVGKTDVAAARARLQDAEAALNLARQRAIQGVVRAPMAGVIYGLVVRTGGYVNPGDLLANVGKLDRLRVQVYVDEPELGRVGEGQPVTITWQALAGKQWDGRVERTPSSIQPLGTRQVGEVICSIENPGHELIPGTNVDAVIRTAVVPKALVIPKESLRRDAEGSFVLLLTGDAVERRAVTTGFSSISEVEITQGLAEGDTVALPSEIVLKPGDRVTPEIGGA